MQNVLMTKDMVLSEKLTEKKGVSMWELMCNAATLFLKRLRMFYTKVLKPQHFSSAAAQITQATVMYVQNT